jgi:putative phage-type endonuclease
MLRHRSPEWYAARRELITATDIPVILGLSPYKSESTLAQEKRGETPEQSESLVMQIGRALEPVIAGEYSRLNAGVKLTRYAGLVKSKRISWAAASPDYRRARQPYLVELKDSRSRRWPSEGVPQDIEAQVRWQLGVTGFPVGDVAALRWGKVEVTTIEHDAALFDELVVIAEDFRRRLAEGGPFAEDAASIKTRYPADDGAELVADEKINALVADLQTYKAHAQEAELWISQIETDLKARMATASRLTGDGWSITWRKSKDSEQVDWESIARAYKLLLDAQTERVELPDWLVKLGGAQLTPGMLDAIQSIHTGIKSGGRAFRLNVKEQGEVT